MWPRTVMAFKLRILRQLSKFFCSYAQCIGAHMCKIEVLNTNSSEIFYISLAKGTNMAAKSRISRILLKLLMYTAILENARVCKCDLSSISGVADIYMWQRGKIWLSNVLCM